MKEIPFSKPVIAKNTEKYIKQVLKSGKLSGDHDFTKKCNRWIEDKTGAKKALLTSSCTHALEMAAFLIDVKEGNEVIMSPFTFPSTANAFILRGAKAVFVDIRPDTMNIDEHYIEQAINEKTKAIVPVHYGGIGCEMDVILDIANKYDLYVIEDAAQVLMSTYKNRDLGTIGSIGAYSFHETKSYTCGEGGAILLNDEKFFERAEILREKGTNRSKYFRGEIDKYSWQDVGSSYLMSELNAAILYAQLEMAEEITIDRLKTWNTYYQNLSILKEKGYVELPVVPEECGNNGHLFYVKAKDLDEMTRLMHHLKTRKISASFHYIPLHTSKAGRKYGRFQGEDKHITKESERLLRLPIYYGISEHDISDVCRAIKDFYDI